MESPNYRNRISHSVIEESLDNSCCMVELKLEINFASLQVKVKQNNKLHRATKPQMLKQKYQTGLKSVGLTDVTAL